MNKRSLLRLKHRQYLINKLGGKCIVCGSEEVFNLHFHHFIPSIKRMKINQALRTKGFEFAKSEIKRCVLMCTDCHKKEHGWNE